MSDEAKSPDEQPKKKVAKKVISKKQLYFMPDHSGPAVEAESIDEAVAMLNSTNKEEEGDAKS